MKLSIIICAYNERDTILTVLDRVQAVSLGSGWEKEIIVVDNCSTDGTRELLQSVTAPNVRIIYQPHNMGKGLSIRTGFRHAAGDYGFVQDADLEYDPADQPRFLGKALAENLDAVYGSRTLGGRAVYIYAVNYWAVRGLTGLTNLLFGARYTDVATASKMVRTSVFNLLNLNCSGFDLDFELSNKLARGRYRVGEVAIDYHPRSIAQGKKIRAADGLRALWVILRDRLIP
ncbi:MAG: glycosyltransferase family 2 protein [Chloroflexi bacterium]|nr:glycosyltransferase family 2 protein [Chloroflexota bacterium]